MNRVRTPTPQEADDLAVIGVMHDMPLKPGQMLLLGPVSVRMLKEGTFRGVLPDKFTFEEAEWRG